MPAPRPLASGERHRVRQCRVVITPWASGHVTVDLISRCWSGADHWDRRTGHLDLDIDPGDLSGLTCRDIIRLLADAPDAVAQVNTALRR